MSSLDLRSINLADKNILTFATKKAAKQYAKENPLPHLCYITEAANRFWEFYVIVRHTQSGEFGVMRKDRQFMPYVDRRWIGGDKTYIVE